MTPKHKALIEYGKAFGRQEEFRRNHQNHPCVQNLTMRHFWRTAPVCCDQKTISNRHAELIRDAWQKQAACRAWTIPSHERLCENCAHGGTRPYETPCRECFRSTFALSYEMVSDNWEPRKEGE